jgi:hypothetical protein
MSTLNANLTLPRAVDVDDSDEGIVYSGSWTIHEGDFDEYKGPVYRGSQHRLLNGTGTLSFKFNGGCSSSCFSAVALANIQKGTGKVGIYGTSYASNNSGLWDPSHSCMLDGIDFRSDAPRRMSPGINGWYLCYHSSNYSNAEHNITLTANSNETAFYVDGIVFEPDPASPPKAPTVRILDHDLAVEYPAGGWKESTIETFYGVLTEQAGAKMRITFNGEFISPLRSCIP